MQSSARLKCDKIESMLRMKNARAKTAHSVTKLEKNSWCFLSFASFIQQGNFTQVSIIVLNFTMYCNIFNMFPSTKFNTKIFFQRINTVEVLCYRCSIQGGLLNCKINKTERTLRSSIMSKSNAMISL